MIAWFERRRAHSAPKAALASFINSLRESLGVDFDLRERTTKASSYPSLGSGDYLQAKGCAQACATANRGRSRFLWAMTRLVSSEPKQGAGVLAWTAKRLE